MIHINRYLENRMLKEAKVAYPHECCGLLVGNSNDSGKVIHEVYPVENKNKVRAADRYEIDPKEFDRIEQAATKKGWNITGIIIRTLTIRRNLQHLIKNVQMYGQSIRT